MNRIRVWYIAVSAVFLLTVFELPAQVAPRQFSDAENATAYTRLFRRTNLLIAKAKAAESPDEPTARLNTVLPRQLNLSDFDAKTLVRVAQEWQTAFTPLQAKRVHEVQIFRAARSHIPLNASDAILKQPLLAIESEMNALALRERDMMHNAMRAEDFAIADAAIHRLFSSTRVASSNDSGEVTK